jgi:hypothetical protein
VLVLYICKINKCCKGFFFSQIKSIVNQITLTVHENRAAINIPTRRQFFSAQNSSPLFFRQSARTQRLQRGDDRWIGLIEKTETLISLCNGSEGWSVAGVARFFLLQHTKSGKDTKTKKYSKFPKIYQITKNIGTKLPKNILNYKNIPNAIKYTKCPYNIPNVNKIYQMSIKHTKCP